MKFRKKPIVIEAYQWIGSHTGEMPDWVEGTIDDGCFYIETLEGEMKANPGDWIIRGIKGELYPCKPDIFDATYERVEE